MHTDHSTKESGVITMAFISGLFILGKLLGGNKLTDPRIFSIIENGKRIMLSPLPGTPSFITLGPDGFHYPMPINDDNANIFDLYDRVTHPQPQSNIVLPGGGIAGQGGGNVVKLN